MASDLDRAYVINGDDLRIELSGGGNSPPIVPNPRDVAEYILSRIARPLPIPPETHYHRTPCTCPWPDKFPGGVIRVEQLAAWFREHEFTAVAQGGAKAAYPEALAETILEDITGQAHPMPVDAEIAEQPDAEIAAIDAICQTLAHLGDADAVRRIIRYLRARFTRET